MVRCRRLFYYFNGRDVSHQIKASTRRNGFHKKECTEGVHTMVKDFFHKFEQMCIVKEVHHSSTTEVLTDWFLYFYIRHERVNGKVYFFILSLHKQWSFLLRISSVNVTKSAVFCGFGADLVTFTEEILNRKLYFLCSVWYRQVRWDCLSLDCHLASLKYFGICNTFMMKRFCRNL